jgi:hypothetical protein
MTDPDAVEREVLAELSILGRATVRQLASRLSLDPFDVHYALVSAGQAVDFEGGLWRITPVFWNAMRRAS